MIRYENIGRPGTNSVLVEWRIMKTSDVTRADNCMRRRYFSLSTISIVLFFYIKTSSYNLTRDI